MASGRAFHVLVVDCDENTVSVTRSMLERLGYTTQGESKSLTALRTFSDNPGKFDLAIIEPVMPELMGVELAVRLRRIMRGFPVMLYARHVDPPLAETIQTAGLRQPTLKPLGLQELGDAVKQAVHPAPLVTH